MRITEQFLNVLLICCREKLQHVWDFYTILVWMCVCGDFTKQCSVVMAWLVCVCVCVWEARFLMSSGHWAEREKAYHISIYNVILDNAFCVHGNKMVKLHSTMVPAVSKNACGRQQCKGKDDRHLYSANTSVHYVTLFCFWLFELTKWWQMIKLCYTVCCEKYRRKNVREHFQIFRYLPIAYIWWHDI